MKHPIELLADGVRNCQLCPLAKGRTRAVPGEGPSDAMVVLVGEAPGKDEDLSGRPFVGRAGRILDSTLDSVGVRRKGVYVTNVVKCRPPKNRPPTAAEAETCKEALLLRELKLIRPEVTVLLGRTASKAILDVDTLKSVRGKFVNKEGMKYLCAYHPAAVLRNPRLQGEFSRDLRNLNAGPRCEARRR